jgi:hypothetical protein
VRIIFIKRMLTLRRLREAVGKVFPSLGLGLGLSGIRRRWRWGRASAAGQHGRRDQNEDEPLERKGRTRKASNFSLCFHERCRQGNVFNLPQAARQYEEQILVS